MVRIGIHAFVWNGHWDTPSGNQAIERTARAGFDFLEIPLFDPSTFDAQSHKAALKRENLEAVCSLALPRDKHMPHHPQAALNFLTEVLEQMDSLGARYLAGCVGYSLGVLTGLPPTPQERQTVVDILGEVCARADKLGITLALEACNRYETYMYNTLADTRDTILKVAASNLKLHADTYHMNIEETDFATPLVQSADVLDYLHMSESHRGLVGSGTVNWPQVFEGLKQANFSGSLALESFAAINEEIAAATCLWRTPLHDSQTLATEGLKFLREGAARAGLS